MPPDLGTVGRGAIVLVVVEREPVKREVRLRTAAGQLAGRALTDSRGVAVLTVPSGEAWLVDVVGTEAVAVPVLSGDVVRVVLGG